MKPDVGKDLAHYRVVEKIGEGGMGEVWKALDTTLDRDVAIKVLPDVFSDNPDRLARFEREARVLASLNHPNIAAIYGLHESDGVRFLAMELVPGEDLSTRVARGALPMDDALDISIQIAAALEAAHGDGIVHRDLKPANVRLTPDGKVKVLDFGLAKAIAPDPVVSASDPSMPPTMTSAGTTAAGVILGTAAYMSPEQARGKAVDRRTDLWAFGCVLYEMLTGVQAFAGETMSDCLAAVLRGEADTDALPAGTPRSVRRLMRRALEKDPARRLRDAGDARIELEEAREQVVSGISETTPAPADPAPSRGRSPWLAILGVVIGLAVGVGLMRTLAPGRPGPAGMTHLSADFPEELRLTGSGILHPFNIAISNDGRAMVVSAFEFNPDDRAAAVTSHLYVRELDDDRFRLLTETERVGGQPRFSPDGRDILYVTADRGNRIARVPRDGSAPPSTVLELKPDWTGQFVALASGDIVVLTRDQKSLVRVSPGGGTPGEPVAIRGPNPSATYRIWKHAELPDGERVLANSLSYDDNGWTVGVVAIDTRDGTAEVVVDNGGNPSLAIPGRLLFSRGDELLSAPFDDDTGQLTGEAVALRSGLRTPGQFIPAAFDVSPTGTLVFASGGAVGEQRIPATVDPDGTIHRWDVEPRAYAGSSPIAVSADSSTVAMIATSVRGIDEIWASRIDDPNMQRAASFPGADCGSPSLSNDGTWLAFTRNANDEDNGVYVVPLDASASPRRILDTTAPGDRVIPTSWSPDGRRMLVTILGPTSSIGLLTVPDEGQGEVQPLIDTPNNDAFARFSPDGNWIAFQSDRSGEMEVVVARFDGSAIGRAVAVTRSGGQMPTWSEDGRTVLAASRRRALAIPVSLGAAARPGKPVVLVELQDQPIQSANFIPGGGYVAIMQGPQEDGIKQFDILLDWAGADR